MPSGAIHHKAWKKAKGLGVAWGVLLLALFSFIGGYQSFVLWGRIHYISNGIIVGTSAVLGYLLGSLLDPDLDLVGATGAEGRMMKIPVLGVFLYGYWAIYGAVFRKQHRSFWTHSYVFSTAIRFVYQFWFVLFQYYILDQVLLGLFFGLALSDAIHIFLDMNKKAVSIWFPNGSRSK